jgi:glucose-6-phosphate isomerase
LVGINAYHQPGVEAGKKAAGVVIELQGEIQAFLAENAGKAFTASQIAGGLNRADDAESVFKICQHLAANGSGGISRQGGTSPGTVTFSA